jgi:CRP/FNR family transcriptional regulator, cyclic AMP receptor protein
VINRLHIGTACARAAKVAILRAMPPEQKNLPATADLLAILPAPLRDLAALGVVRRYRANTTLMVEGDGGDRLFVVLSGSLRIFCADPNGREFTLAIYGPGEYVGEMSLDGSVRSACVSTEEASVCAVVSGQSLRQHLATNLEFTLELIRRLIRRTRLTTENARSLALLDAYGRLARLFDGLAVARADGTRMIAPRLTHKNIAERIGCSRELVSRLLKDLHQGGYVALEAQRYVLLRKLPAKW